MLDFLKDFPSTAVVILWEEGKPKDKNFQKVLELKHCSCQEFAKLLGDNLTKWVQSEVKEAGGTIQASTAHFLVGEVGDDLYQLKQEIEKLISFNKDITSDAIKMLVKANLFSNVFDMVDAFGLRNSSRALKEMHKLLDSGESEMYVLSMIVRQFRNIIMIKDLKSKGLSLDEIAKDLKIHPFVVKKTLSQASCFSFSELKVIYTNLLEAEVKIKTGDSPPLVLDLLAAGIIR